MHETDVVIELQDLRHLTWAERATSSGTSGCFLKSREGKGPNALYYKLSCYDSYRGIYGHECVNEIIAARLMERLGIPHASYRLVHAIVTIDGVDRAVWLTQSPSFRQPGERKQAFDLFYDLHRTPGESPLEFCERQGWKQAIDRMLLVDYLIANQDRHGANIEVLVSPHGSTRLAPLFDNGLSFVFSCYGDENRAAAFDPLSDINANNYIGTRSLEENLRFISTDLEASPMTSDWHPYLFRGLENVLNVTYRNKIWDILWKRWNRAQDLRHPERR